MSAALDQLIAQGMPDAIVSGFQKGVTFGDNLYSNAIKLQQARQELELNARRQDLAELAQKQGYQIQSGQLGIEQSKLEMSQRLQPYIIKGQDNANKADELKFKNDTLSYDFNVNMLGKTTDLLDSMGAMDMVWNSETDGRQNANMITRDKGDHGGTTYGIGLTVKDGHLQKALPKFIAAGFTDLEGLTPDTPAFDAAWNKSFNKNPELFKQVQEADAMELIKPVKDTITRETGIDTTQYSELDNLVNSQINQRGTLAATNFKNAVNLLKAQNAPIDEKNLIQALVKTSSDAAGSNFKSSSASEQQSAGVTRIMREGQQALARLQHKELLGGKTEAQALNDNLDQLKINLPTYDAFASTSKEGQQLSAAAVASANRLLAQIKVNPDASKEAVQREAVRQAVNLPPEQRQAVIDKVMEKSNYLSANGQSAYLDKEQIAAELEKQAQQTQSKIIKIKQKDEFGNIVDVTTNLKSGYAVVDNPDKVTQRIVTTELDDKIRQKLVDKGNLLSRLDNVINLQQQVESDPKLKAATGTALDEFKADIFNRYFGISPNETLSKLRAGNGEAIASYIQSVSGMAVTEGERKALTNVIGSPSMADFLTRFKEFTRNQASAYTSLYDTEREGALTVPKELSNFREMAGKMAENLGGNTNSIAQNRAGVNMQSVLKVPDDIAKLSNREIIDYVDKTKQPGQTGFNVGGKYIPFKNK